MLLSWKLNIFSVHKKIDNTFVLLLTYGKFLVKVLHSYILFSNFKRDQAYICEQISRKMVLIGERNKQTRKLQPLYESSWSLYCFFPSTKDGVFKSKAKVKVLVGDQ